MPFSETGTIRLSRNFGKCPRTLLMFDAYSVVGENIAASELSRCEREADKLTAIIVTQRSTHRLPRTRSQTGFGPARTYSYVRVR